MSNETAKRIDQPADSALSASPGSAIDWKVGPALGGDGTAGTNRWWDGDRLLCIVELKEGKDVFVAHVSADEDDVSLLDYCGDVLDWSVFDLCYYAKINDSILPNNDERNAE